MASLIQVRRDTLSNWNSNDPVLANGEIAFVTNENKFKVGNGTDSFTELPYLQADAYIDSVVLGTDTTGNYAAQVTGTGAGISVTGSGESASVVIENTGVTSLSGTANEVEVSASTGSVTLSLPSTINANTTGNAATATALQTARTISLGGDLSGSASFDGTGNITITASVDSQSSVNSITGTENEISVSASVGDITLSLPDTINANTTGSAATLTNARAIALGGDLSGSATFDGSASISITAEIQPNSVVLGTDTTGNYVATASAGSGISISGSGSEDAAITISNTGVTSLTGTANQITVSASNGDATLSFPSAVTFPGTVTLNANPQQALEAVTKQYVDAIAEGLHIHASVATATTASVDLGNAPTAIDGVNLTDGMRVLVKNQSTTADNGIYAYSASADALVRASDFNSAAEIQGGDFLFVTGGNTYADTGWVQTETVTTLGTDPILFTQFSGAGTYSAGTGLQLDGTVFSNTGVLSLSGTANEVEVSASSGSITVSLPSTINANTTGSAATLTTSRTIELSGDVSGSASFDGSANASISSTLANTAVTPATYGSASAVGTVTVDSKGRVTGASNTAIAIAQSAVTNLTTDLAGKAPLASPALTGTPTAPTAAVDTNTTQIATTAYVIGQSYLKSSTASSTYAPLASPTFTGTVSASTINISTADTATTASHYIVETGSDGVIRPKTLANVRTEIVTQAAVNSASATVLGTVTAGTWNASTISATYIDSAIARLASPALTGTPTAPTAALGTSTTQIATTEFVESRFDTTTINTQTASYGLVLADAGKTIEMNVASANNLTVPLNSSQAFPVGTTIDIIQYGAGQTTIVATGGVTIRSKEGKLKLTGQYSGATLYKRGTDEWVVVGDLTT